MAQFGDEERTIIFILSSFGDDDDVDDEDEILSVNNWPGFMNAK